MFMIYLHKKEAWVKECILQCILHIVKMNLLVIKTYAQAYNYHMQVAQLFSIS